MTLSHAIASALNIVGLVIILAGSMVTARAVILKPRDAIRIAGQSGATGWGAGVKRLPDICNSRPSKTSSDNPSGLSGD
jgi:hypothetical protein